MFSLVLEALKAPWQTGWVFADDIHQELTMSNCGMILEKNLRSLEKNSRSLEKIFTAPGKEI